MKKITTVLLTLALVLTMGLPIHAANDTPVKFKVSDTQISVAVPVEIVGTVNWNTGEITFPAATSTKIKNNSVFAIKVASIQCSAESGWTLAATGGSTADTIVATISPDSGTTKLPLLTASQACAGEMWNMGAADVVATPDDSLELTLAGAIENAGEKTAALGTTEATAFTITFTVEAGAN